MSFTVSITDGVTTLPLVYSDANQYAFKALYGASIDPGEPTPVYHQPEGYPPELIDLYDPNRTAVFGFNLASTTSTNKTNDVLNGLAVLRRWIDGAHQQAARYWIHGDVNRIDLIIQRDNSTVATYHPVVFGTVDDGTGQYSTVANLNNMVFDAVIRLTLAPYGESQNDITLYNYLLGGAVDFESATSGLADGWASTGTTTNTLDTSIYLINGKTQKCNASADGGVTTDVFTKASTSGSGYAWVYVVSGSVDVDLYDSTATTVRDSAVIDATDSGGVSDRSIEDSSGNTWYRVPISSASLTSGNNHIIRIRASGGAAVWYHDVVYFNFDVTTVPDAWCSYSNIDNRSDRTTTNPDRIDHIDVWGIPGDADALVRHTIVGTTTEASETFIMSAFKDKASMLAINFDHVIEGEDMTEGTVLNGSWADAVVAGTSAGSVAQFTTSATGATAFLYASLNYTNHPVNVWVRAKASVGSVVSMALYQAPTTVSANTIITSAPAVTLTTDYQLYFIGTVQLQNPISSGVTSGSYSIGVSGFNAGSQTADIDCAFHHPTVDGMVLLKDGYPAGTFDTGSMVLDGFNEESYIDYRLDALGIYPTASSGQRVTRFYYSIRPETTNLIHHLDDAMKVTYDIVPRTKHLLGTV